MQRRFSALCGNGQLKGDTLFQKRVSPFKSPERNFTLAVCSSKSCTRCAIGCGVHGFAMNPCDSTHPATAPYYREARVTVERRQTACGMRHCFARRIEECHGRRKLSCTPTRWAERQRIVEAEANRLAMLTRLCRAQALRSGGKRLVQARDCQSKPFLLGGVRGAILFPRKENSPPLSRPHTVWGTFLPHEVRKTHIISLI